MFKSKTRMMTSLNKNFLFTVLVTTVIVLGVPRLAYAQQEDGPDYSGICETLQPVLIQSCDTLVNDDGSLTPDGTHAIHCIRNGILLGTGASLDSHYLLFLRD